MWPNASYLQRLVKHYGVTDEPLLGGYLLPDGRFLDFSEGSGSRSQDHRNITWVLPPKWEQPHMSRWDGLVRIARRTGIIRWMPENWALDAFTSPTDEQAATIAELARYQELMVEAQDARGGKYMNIYPPGRQSGYLAAQHLRNFFRYSEVPPVNFLPNVRRRRS